MFLRPESNEDFDIASRARLPASGYDQDRDNRNPRLLTSIQTNSESCENEMKRSVGGNVTAQSDGTCAEEVTGLQSHELERTRAILL